MHPTNILSALLFSLATTVHTATIADLITSTAALTTQADTIDAAVVALTAQTPPTTVQQIPPSLQDLTTALTTTITASTPTPPTSDPELEFTLLDTYGLFANTIWELMSDYTYHGPFLISSNLQSAMFSQLTNFNSAFQDLSMLTTGVFGDEVDKIDMGFYIGNTTVWIENALEAFKL